MSKGSDGERAWFTPEAAARIASDPPAARAVVDHALAIDHGLWLAGQLRGSGEAPLRWRFARLIAVAVVNGMAEDFEAGLFGRSGTGAIADLALRHVTLHLPVFDPDLMPQILTTEATTAEREEALHTISKAIAAALLRGARTMCRTLLDDMDVSS